MIQNEVSILRRVKHPNIVLLIEEMDVPTELYLVMELVKVSILETKQSSI
jgi:doublecortin-like kinase 1/2